MSSAIGAALVVAAIGLWFVRTAPAWARLSMWGLLLGLAAVAGIDPAVDYQAVARSPVVVASGGDAVALRTALLQAGATAGPRAVDMIVPWGEPLPDSLAPAPFGAIATVPPPLPFAPAALQLRAMAPAAVDRPLALQLEPVALAAPLPAVLRLRFGGTVLHEEPVQLGPATAVLTAFVPDRAGVHELELAVAVAGHRVLAHGELRVGPAPEVLVLEPSGLAAAALRAQGLAVVAASAPPADWRRFAAVVLGQPLPEPVQQELVVAVLDGVGLFVLAPGFSTPASPLRALLPLRPLPPVERGASGAGATAGAVPPPADPVPPPIEPPTKPPVEPPSPPPNRPPTGDVEGAGPVSAEPIEVDKRAIAMVLVVDRSGSMGNLVGATGYTKMSYAKTSALQTARALGPGDQVGLITFGNKDAGRVELPLTDATATAAVRAGIEALVHGNEQTFLLSGLQAAHRQLRGSPAAVKHVVVISDGEFFTSEEIALMAAAQAMRTDRISLSVISIVDAATNPQFRKVAEEMTRAGGGQFLPTPDPTSVPVFVTAEVTRALQRVGRKPRPGDGGRQQPAPPDPGRTPPPAPPPPEPAPPAPAPPVEAPARVVVRAVSDSRLLLPRPEPWPTLGAATATEAPLDAQVHLVAGDEGWPLLAFGSRGLGRVGAFAADVCGEAGAEFRRDEAFAARFAQWVQNLLPALPVLQPAPLLQPGAIEPPAPTPAEVDALTVLAGIAPVRPGALPPPLPELRRGEASRVPATARWLLLGLVVVAALERWLLQAALRRGQSL